MLPALLRYAKRIEERDRNFWPHAASTGVCAGHLDLAWELYHFRKPIAQYSSALSGGRGGRLEERFGFGWSIDSGKEMRAFSTSYYQSEEPVDLAHNGDGQIWKGWCER